MTAFTTGPAPATASPAPRSRRELEDALANDLAITLSSLPPGDPSRPQLRDRVIAAWLPMSVRLSRRYTRRGEPDDDLRQVAALGLIKAVDRFNPTLNPDFSSYAIPTILGELRRHFRDRAWTIRIPRRLQELRPQISRAQLELTQKLKTSPTITDVADYLNVSEEDVLETLESGNAYRAVSLSTPLDDQPGWELADTIGIEDHGFELADFTAALPPAMTCLTDREKHILTLRFYGNLSQADIAQHVGVSQMHVSRLLAGALHKLRERMS